MHPSAAGETFWIADERPYSMNEIVDTVEHLLEGEFGQTCTHKRLRLPGVVSDVAQVCDAALQKCGVYHQKIHVLSEMNKTIAGVADIVGIDLTAAKKHRAAFGFFRDRRPELYGRLTEDI